MGTSLTGKNISASYLGLLKTTDNAVIGGTAKIITDGNGNDSPLYLSTSAVGIGIASPTLKLEVSGNAEIDGINIGKGNNSITTNTAIGVNALNVNSALGNLNTAIGYSAMASNTDGEQNVAIGAEALLSNTTGDQNVAIGDDSLKANTEGESNTAIGKNSLTDNTSGDNNTAVGRLAISGNTIGLYNVGVGSQALNDNISGDKNTALGFDALTNSSSGDGNIGIGANVGSVLSSGSNNIIIGRDAEVNAGSSTNEIVIGYNVTGNGSNTVTIGNSSITANHFSGKIYFGGDLSQISNNELRFYGSSGKSISNYGIGTGLIFKVSNTASADTNVLNFSSNGNATIYKNLNLSSYGSGTITGTATQRLGVDSSGNVIEIPIGSGAVDGSGTANTVTMWSDTDTITDAPITISGNNSTFAGNIITSGNILFNEDRIIARNTSDGSDNGYIAVVGGGAESDGRGAIIRLYGNENAENGRLAISTGNNASSFMDFRVAGSEAMRLDSSGNLALGTTSASRKLTVSSSGVIADFISSTTSSYIDIEGTTGQLRAGVFDGVVGIANGTGTTAHLAINSSGDVGIGSASPSAKLHIKTSNVSNTNQFLLESTDAGASSAPDLALYRNSASPADDDVLGALWFYGNNDASAQELYSGIISVASDVSDGTEDSEIRFLNMVNGTLDTRMTIDGTNVGIGTTSPSYPLTVDTGAGTFSVRAKGSGSVSIASDASLTYFGDTHEFYNSAGDTEHMRLDSSGNLLLGTTATSNAEKLHIHTSDSGKAIIKLSNSTTGTGSGDGFEFGINSNEQIEFVNKENTDMFFLTNNTERLRIENDGDIQIQTVGAQLRFQNSVGSAPYIKNSGEDSSTAPYGQNLEFYTGGSKTLTLDNSQNVGIGITPSYDLHLHSTSTGVSDSSDFAMGVTSNDSETTPRVLFQAQKNGTNGGRLVINTLSGGSLSERMRITSDGLVGINNTNPSAKCHIGSGSSALISGSADELMVDNAGNSGITIGSGASDVGSLFFADSGANASGYIQYAHSNDTLYFGTTSTERMLISSGGTVSIPLGTRDTGGKGGALIVGGDADSNGLTTNTRKIGLITCPSYDNTDGNMAMITGDTSDSTTNYLYLGSAYTGYSSPTDIVFRTTSTVGSIGSERMRLDSSGNLGLGTSSPESKTHIIDTSNPDTTSGSLIIEGRRDGGANVLTLRAKDASNPSDALPNGQGAVMRFQGFDGTDFENMGYIFTGADGQAVANGDAPSFMAFGTSADGSSSPSERMRITSGGRVGIGEDSPQEDLHITGDTPAIRFTDSDTSRDAQIVSIDGNLRFDADNNNAQASTNIAFRTDGTERMRITSGGDVCTGTTTGRPDTTNDSGWAINPDGKSYVFSGADFGVYKSDATGKKILFRYGTDGATNTEIGSIEYDSTSSVAYNTSSDYRLKEDLQDFDGLSMINNINVYDFKWKDDKKRSYGVIAHELQKVVPNIVSGEKDGEEMQGVDYSKLVPILLKSIQELKAEIDELKKNK